MKEGKIRLESTKLSLGKVLNSVEFFAHSSLVNSREAKVSVYMGIRNRTGPPVDPAAGAGNDLKNTRKERVCSL